MALPITIPEAGHRRSSDCDPPLPLLRHPVRDRRARIHGTHPVNATGVEENALGRRRLTRINVSDDANVSYATKRVLCNHHAI